MSHEITLRTAHPAVEQLVSEWLHVSRIALPRPVTLDIDVGPLPPLPSGSKFNFRQGNVAVSSAGPGMPLAIEWGPGMGRCVLDTSSTTAKVIMEERALERPNEMLRLFLMLVCTFLLRRVGFHHIHGAVLLSPQNKGLLLVGVSGSGKSTTTALLARRGWQVGTDDIAFMCAGEQPGTTDIVPWRERLALHADSASAIGHHGGADLEARQKIGWFVEDLGTTWVQRVRPELIVLPTASADAPTSVRPLRAQQSLARIMPSSPWVSLEAEYADEHLDLLTRLVKQSRSFEATVGRDLFDRPDILPELLA
ncbi:MAG: HPr kinase [Gemmatimonadetes bacterium]|nr:HPr kinase [Gemmatimonadota bacterium]